MGRRRKKQRYQPKFIIPKTHAPIRPVLPVGKLVNVILSDGQETEMFLQSQGNGKITLYTEGVKGINEIDSMDGNYILTPNGKILISQFNSPRYISSSAGSGYDSRLSQIQTARKNRERETALAKKEKV
jgi:hypothetical protein